VTIHYHGTPITPRRTLNTLAGKHFCVSFADPRDVEVVHKIGQSVMLDNGAFSFWKSGTATDWGAYFGWCEEWLSSFPTTWAVIPDVIDGTETENNDLLAAWWERFGTYHRAAPVWHINESFQRLDRFMQGPFDKICLGSSGEYADVGTHKWHGRMVEVFNHAHRSGRRRSVWFHMLRGMKFSRSPYPFASVDSTDVARNHHSNIRTARHMADLWDAQQCPGDWEIQPTQRELKEHKFCPKCEREKDSREFATSTLRADGRQGYCRKCIQSYGAERTGIA
jgi:hypothetical protein